VVGLLIAQLAVLIVGVGLLVSWELRYQREIEKYKQSQEQFQEQFERSIRSMQQSFGR